MPYIMHLPERRTPRRLPPCQSVSCFLFIVTRSAPVIPRTGYVGDCSRRSLTTSLVFTDESVPPRSCPLITAHHRHTRRTFSRLLLLATSLTLAVAGLAAFAVAPASATSAAEPEQTSSLVTWDCTGSPCPWGAQTRSHAAVWPAVVSPISNRHGYTTSVPVYAPGATTAGYKVAIHSGSASIYAGTPTGSHRLIAALGSGETATLPVIGAGEVFSVQSEVGFTYILTPGSPPRTPTRTRNYPDPSGPELLVVGHVGLHRQPLPVGCPDAESRGGVARGGEPDLQPARLHDLGARLRAWGHHGGLQGGDPLRLGRASTPAPRRARTG